MQQEQYLANTQQQSGQQYQHNFSVQAMRHYFYKPSRTYIWLSIIGALLFIIGASASASIPGLGTPFIVLGIGLVLGGGIPLLMHYSDMPSDDQYAKWISERSQPLYSKALQRLHLDESQCESIVEVQGGFSSVLQFTKKFPEKEVAVKRLSNGLRHYSINVCTYIFLTKNDLAIYSGYINAFAQNERFEDADHYYYKDIVGVSTSGPIYTISSEKEIQMQGFFVRISNGEAVGTDYATKVELRGEGNRMIIQGVDPVVAELLALLRDHNVTLIEANRIAGDLS